MLYFSVIQSMAILLAPSHTGKSVAQAPHFTFTPPSSLEIIILVVVVIIMLAVTLYALVKVPLSVAKTSNRVVHKTAESIAPIILKAQHREDTEKVRLKLTSKLLLFVKLLLIVVPLALTVASGFLEKQPLSYSIIMTVGYGLAAACIVLFVVQYSLASWLHVNRSDIW